MSSSNTPQAILILGMHRSGTSALSRVMSLLGAKLPKTLLGKNESNNRGHWESEVLIANHDALLGKMKSEWKDWRQLPIGALSAARKRALKDDFIDDITQEYGGAKRGGGAQDILVIKEPRICRFSKIYLEALDEFCEDENGNNVHCVISVRHPLEVAASLTSRDNIPKIDGLFLWLTHMLEAEHASRGRSRSVLTYDNFLSSPVECSEALAEEMPFALPYSAAERRGEIEGYVNPNLKRHAVADEDIVLDPVARGWISESYDAFQVLAKNPKSKAALEVLDGVRSAYFAALEPMFTVLTEQRAAHDTQQTLLKAELQKRQDTEGENKSAVTLYMDEAKAQAAHAETLSAKLTTSEGALASYKQEAKALADKLASNESALAAYKDEAKAQETQVSLYQKRLSDAEQQLKSSEAGVQAYKDEAQAQDAKAAALSDEIDFMRREFRGLLGEADRKIEEADSKIEGLYGELSSRDEALRARSAQGESLNRELENVNRELDSVLKSSSWKMTAGLRGLVNLLRGKNAGRPSPALESKDEAMKLDYKPWDSGS